jgi:hypothetical protein
VLQRILLFLNPAIGHSVRRIYDLAQLFVGLAPGVAMHLVAIWREAAPDVPRPTPHQPLLWNDEVARSGRAPSVATARALQPASTPARSLIRR